MEIPQELIDAIIDEFPLRLDSDSDLPDPETKRTLQSCALVSRPFLQRCQMHIFSRISVWDSYLPTFPLACQRLAAVLSSSPHLAGYIQTLELVYNADDSLLVEFVPRILSAVTAVDTLQLSCDMWDHFPFDSSMITVFSLPSLRRLALCGWELRNPLELQSLLNLSASLQELTLQRVSFTEVENNSENSPAVAQRNISSSIDQGLVLESLRLVCIEPHIVEMMLESFTAMDIKHLKSLSFLSTSLSPLNGFLRANAGSLQKLRISDISLRDFEYRIDPDILTSANYLSSIEFEESYLEYIPLRLLGDLASLRALTRIQIVLLNDLHEDMGEFDIQRWAEVDAFLVRVHSAEVNIYASFCEGLHCIRPHRMDLHTIEVVEKWLPLVSSSGRLHVYSRADCSPLTIY